MCHVERNPKTHTPVFSVVALQEILCERHHKSITFSVHLGIALTSNNYNEGFRRKSCIHSLSLRDSTCIAVLKLLLAQNIQRTMAL
jgi:hypothetical protein